MSFINCAHTWQLKNQFGILMRREEFKLNQSHKNLAKILKLEILCDENEYDCEKYTPHAYKIDVKSSVS